MTPIIDHTIFVGDINIPNTNQVPVMEHLSDLIVSAQDELLAGTLGLGLYVALSEGLSEDPADQKWIDLRDGVTYDYLGHKYRHAGLKSGLAYYVFYKFMDETATTFSGTGEKKSKNENAESYPVFRRMVDAWNRMVKVNVATRDYVNRNYLLYSEAAGLGNSKDHKFFTVINTFGL